LYTGDALKDTVCLFCANGDRNGQRYRGGYIVSDVPGNSAFRHPPIQDSPNVRIGVEIYMAQTIPP